MAARPRANAATLRDLHDTCPSPVGRRMVRVMRRTGVLLCRQSVSSTRVSPLLQNVLLAMHNILAPLNGVTGIEATLQITPIRCYHTAIACVNSYDSTDHLFLDTF